MYPADCRYPGDPRRPPLFGPCNDQYGCSLPFTFSPQPGAPQVMAMANAYNTTFSEKGFNNAAYCCQNAQTAMRLPTWPPKGGSKLYPVRDVTVDAYPVFADYGIPGGNINSWTDNLTGQTTSDVGRWVPDPSGIVSMRAMNPCPPPTPHHMAQYFSHLPNTVF